MTIARTCAAGALLLAGAILAPQSAETAAPAPFSHASGKITYKITGALNGSMTMSWMNNGRKLRQDISGTMKMAASQGGTKPMPLKTWVIYDGKDLYTANPMVANTALKMSASSGGAMMAGGPGALGQPIKGKLVGKGTVAGKPCQIRQQPQGKVWVWSSLPLKFEATQEPKSTMVATSISTTHKPPASKFAVPKGFTIQEFNMPQAGPAGARGRPLRPAGK